MLEMNNASKRSEVCARLQSGQLCAGSRASKAAMNGHLPYVWQYGMALTDVGIGISGFRCISP